MGYSEKKALRQFKTGDVIFKEGDPGKTMYVIQTGKVEVYTKVNKQKTVLAELGPGSIFGEMALIDEQPRSASIRALTEVICLEITELRFKYLLENVPEWMQKFFHILVSRLRVTDQKQKSLPQYVVSKQIVYVLYLILNQAHLKQDESYSLNWDKCIEKISFLLSVPVETIRKTMNRLIHTPLADSKIDFQQGRQFKIVDMAEFEAFARFCKQKYDQSRDEVEPVSDQKAKKSEIEIMSLINTILKDQAGAPDINKELFQDKCVSEHGKDLSAYKNELNALKKRSILKVRQDSNKYMNSTRQ